MAQNTILAKISNPQASRRHKQLLYSNFCNKKFNNLSHHLLIRCHLATQLSSGLINAVNLQ